MARKLHNYTPATCEQQNEIKCPHLREAHTMLSWAITFLIIAIVAALLGFVGLAGIAAEFAKITFFVFLVLFVVSLLLGRRREVV